MIRLGLGRAAQLFKNNPQPWKAVHVAGTNGKGTVCAYLSALLHSSGIRCGRFTSPHLIDKWDCITINEKPVSEALYRKAEADVLERNEAEDIGASEFEILTATAFDIFTKEDVEVAVVEVGMGGRDDATNILKSKDLTVITKIGLDHQAFLGDTTREIAYHKCGIFMKDVPVLYNATNDDQVIEVIKEVTSNLNTQAEAIDLDPRLDGIENLSWSKSIQARHQQWVAVRTAWTAFQRMHAILRPGEDLYSSEAQSRARDVIMDLNWPARYQSLDVGAIVPELHDRKVLLDGAHNQQAAFSLAQVVDSELRQHREDAPIAWVLATTRGRPVKDFIEKVIKAQDRVAAVEFGPVDSMPWVQPLPATDIVQATHEGFPEVETSSFVTSECKKHGVISALEWAGKSQSPIVVTGSLYLASDLLRLLRSAGVDIYAKQA